MNSPIPEPTNNRPALPYSRTESGVALVLTLLVVAMLTVVVVGFTAVSRLEQVSARNMTYQSSAEQLAQLATGKGMQRLTEAMQTALAAPMFSSQPGQINPFGAQPERLFSSGGQTVNVNRFTTNGLITGSPSDNVSVGLETVNDGSGNPIGRIAYFIDDESTKIAVNQATAASNNRPLNPQWPRPFAIQGAQGVNAVRASAFNGILSYSANAPSNSSNWAFFFTPEQLGGPLSAEPLPQLTVALETNPASINTTPWGSQKLRINQVPLTDAGVQQVVQALSDPKLAQVFGQTFADKYTPEGLQQIAANMLQLRTDHWRGGVNFQGVDPIFGLAQVTGSANVPPDAGLRKKTNGIADSHVGYVPFPMLAEVAVGGIEYGFTKGAGAGGAGLNDNMSIRFFVACKIYNPFPIDYPGGGQVFVQVDKARFRIANANPSTLSPVVADQVWRGPDGSHRMLTPGYNDMPDGPGSQPWDPWGLLSGVVGENFEKSEPQVGVPGNFAPPVRQLDPAGGIGTEDLPAIPAQSWRTVLVPFTITTSARHPSTSIYTGAGAEMYIIVDQVRILASRDQAPSVRDWCSGPDMKQAFSQQGTAQFVLPLANIGPPQGSFIGGGYIPSAAPAAGVLNDASRWRALAKKDPRMKAGLEIVDTRPVWRTNAPSLSNINFAISPANFANDPIPSDPGDAQSVLYNSNFPPVLSATNDGSYAMAADLGKVFTGLPWRNLRMQPQPSREASANLIPDWVMLDAVSFGDGTRALNAANPNSQIISASSPVNRRTAAIRSQLDVLTNQTLNIVAHPINAGATNTAPFAAAASRAFQTNATGINQIAANAQQPNLPASWSASSSWRSRRAALGFPANALLLPSEMAEIRGVADFATLANSNKVNEYRLSALFPGAGARSRFYRITALGEALEGKSANAPSAARAVLQTLVEVNTNSTPPSIRIINQYPPAE